MLDLEGSPPASLHDALVLSRPDQHVAWRGDQSPADPLALIDRIRGVSNPINTKGRASVLT